MACSLRLVENKFCEITQHIQPTVHVHLVETLIKWANVRRIRKWKIPPETNDKYVQY